MSLLKETRLFAYVYLYDLSVLCIMACKPSKLYNYVFRAIVDLSNFEIAKMSANFEIE